MKKVFTGNLVLFFTMLVFGQSSNLLPDQFIKSFPSQGRDSNIFNQFDIWEKQIDPGIPIKTESGVIWVRDSILSYDFSLSGDSVLNSKRLSIEFDYAGRIIRTLTKTYWPIPQVWKNDWLHISSFYSSGTLHHHTSFQHDLETQQLSDTVYYRLYNEKESILKHYSPVGRKYYTLDDNDRTTRIVSKIYVNGQLENYYQTLLEYNESGLLSKKTEQTWDGELTDWKNSSQIHFLYDDQNRLTEELRTQWENELGLWRNQLQGLYEYDDIADDWIIHVELEWSQEANEWYNKTKITRDFNAQGDQIYQKKEIWDIIESDWRNESQSIFTYDDEYRLVQKLDQRWINAEAGTGYWRDTKSLDNSYYENGDIYIIEEKEYNGNGFIDHGWRRIFTYDDNNLQKELLYQQHFSFSSGWINRIKQIYFWSEFQPTSNQVSDFPELEIKVYPNPVKDFLLINSEENVQSVSIYALSGSKIRTFRGSSLKQLNLSGLSPGIYLLEIETSDGNLKVRKFLKQ